MLFLTWYTVTPSTTKAIPFMNKPYVVILSCGTLLVTVDVKSLYTNIAHKQEIKHKDCRLAWETSKALQTLTWESYAPTQ